MRFEDEWREPVGVRGAMLAYMAELNRALEGRRQIVEDQQVAVWAERNQWRDGFALLGAQSPVVDRRRAFRVVDDFEAALCEFTGAPFAVTVDSCTNAIFLSLLWGKRLYRGKLEVLTTVSLPTHTYVGVAQAVRNAGYQPKWTDEKWVDFYRLAPFPLWDAAKCFDRGMYAFEAFGKSPMVCVSFQAAKTLPVGRGGAILHDSVEADRWLRAARFDGRTAGAPYSDASYQVPGFHMYMSPPDAARGLWLLTYLEDNDQGDWTEYPNLAEATWD